MTESAKRRERRRKRIAALETEVARLRELIEPIREAVHAETSIFYQGDRNARILRAARLAAAALDP